MSCTTGISGRPELQTAAKGAIKRASKNCWISWTNSCH